MYTLLSRERRFFEVMLVFVVCGMACLAAQLGQYKLVALNLFFLPIILDAYFRGRTSSCILALLAVLAVTIVTVLDPTGLTARYTPIISGLALALWAAVLGIAAILVGTLCDERARTVRELHQAYVGVVEVLTKYLQGGNPNVKARSIRVAELCQLVAEEMRLPQRQIDDIRVAALLHDLGNVEITTNLITKAVDTLDAQNSGSGTNTFAGMDLVHSLGMVLQGAVPLLLSQSRESRGVPMAEDELRPTERPLGAKIIQAVRAFDQLAGGDPDEAKAAPRNALRELFNATAEEFDPSVLKTIERVVLPSARTPAEPAFMR